MYACWMMVEYHNRSHLSAIRFCAHSFRGSPLRCAVGVWVFWVAMEFDAESPLGQLSTYFDTVMFLLLSTLMFSICLSHLTLIPAHAPAASCPVRCLKHIIWAIMSTRSFKTVTCSSGCAAWSFHCFGTWTGHWVHLPFTKTAIRWLIIWLWVDSIQSLYNDPPWVLCRKLHYQNFGSLSTTSTFPLEVRMAVTGLNKNKHLLVSADSWFWWCRLACDIFFTNPVH